MQLDNINKDNTLICFGCGTSNFNELKDLIIPIQEKYDCIGMNIFNYIYPYSKYWNFNDRTIFKESLLNKYKEIEDNKKPLLVTTKEIERYELINNNVKPYFSYNGTTKYIPTNKEEQLLYIYKTTLHTCLNFAVVEEYKNIILMFVDLSYNPWHHFYNCEEENNLINPRPKKRVDIIIESTYKFKDYINIYKTNKNNDLEFEYIDIKNYI